MIFPTHSKRGLPYRYLCKALFAAILVGNLAGPALAGKAMTRKEIQSEIIAKRLSYSGAFSGKITYKSNDTIQYTANGKAFGGTWKFKGNKVCTVLNSGIRGARKSCFSFMRTGKNKYRTSLGYAVWR